MFHNLTNVFLSNDIISKSMIMTNCMEFLLCGHTIKDIEIRADTIKIYMRVVDNYYAVNHCRKPFDGKSDSDVAHLLKEQEYF